MKKSIVFTAALLLVTFCFAIALNTADFSCPPPQNVNKIAETSSSISFAWNSCFCPNQSFEVYYVKDGKASVTYTTSVANFTFANLEAGVYEFHFMTTCGSGTSAEIIIIEDIVVG